MVLTFNSASIDYTLEDGESAKHTLTSKTAEAVRVKTESDQSPYEVNIETIEKPSPIPQNSFKNAINGPVQINTTDENYVGTTTVGGSVKVTITNKSGQEASYTGQIQFSDVNENVSPQEFASKSQNYNNRPAPYVNGDPQLPSVVSGGVEDVEASLGGNPPDATTYAEGTVIRDADAPGVIWKVYDSTIAGGARRLDSGSASNPNEEGYTTSQNVETLDAQRVGYGGPAFVAPSSPYAYSSIQAAIDAGENSIALAETITENNIGIKRDGISIFGWGGSAYQKIIDPEDGNPVFHVAGGRRRDINLAHLKVEGGAASGPVIDTRIPNDTGAALWEIYRCQFGGGPVILLGPRNQLRHVTLSSYNTTKFGVYSEDDDYKTGAALMMAGATCGIMGGSYSNKAESQEAVYFSGAAGSITGGATFTNAGPDMTGVDQRDFTYAGAARMMVGPSSYESSKEYDIQFGLDTANKSVAGLSDSVLLAPSINGPNGEFKLVGANSQNNTVISPLRDLDIQKENPVRGSWLIISNNDVNVSGYFPEDFTHLSLGGTGFGIGSRSSSPETQLELPLLDSPPNFPRDGALVRADGTNWDPVGNGNATLVTYDPGSESWEPIYEYGGTL